VGRLGLVGYIGFSIRVMVLYGFGLVFTTKRLRLFAVNFHENSLNALLIFREFLRQITLCFPERHAREPPRGYWGGDP